MATINEEVRSKANESAKKAKQMSPSVQYAITTALPNISNGAFWGFTDLNGIKNHIDAIKADSNITARKLGNACLVEVNPTYLLQAVQIIDPNALTKKDMQEITKSISEAQIAFEKFLISKGKSSKKTGKQFGGTIGIYCTNDVTTITYRGTSYPAFRVSVGTALTLLATYGYSISINGQFVSASQAANAGDALWQSMVLAPTKTGVFIDIKANYTAEQYAQLEQQFKAKYGLK